MKVLAINGSHRPGKNTAAMLNLVLEEVKAGGIETELIELSDYKIKLCISCNKCLRKSECSIKDDMQALAEKMIEADGIIAGSPVYFCNVTSLFKIFMDRTRWMHMYKNMLEGKLSAAVTHAGLRNGGQEITHALMERFLQAHGLQIVEARDPEKDIFNLGAMGTMFNDLNGDVVAWKRGVSEDPVAVKLCRSLGRNMAQKLNN